jgi:D-arabinose 5-phosphate isomerase GutQ
MKTKSWEQAKAAFSIESDALAQMLNCIDEESFARAVQALASAPRIAASGCGHSGIACMHFAHLMCCIERPARFISPAEAIHGAGGYMQAGDVMLLASRGGKTAELLPILQICRRKQAVVISVTENLESPLARESDIILKMNVPMEVDKYNTQGTTSFVVLCALFDALQSALIEETDYQNEKFAVVHPGGAVGERLNASRISEKL